MKVSEFHQYKFYVQCDEDAITSMDTLFTGLATFCTDIYGNPITFEDEVDAL